MSVITTETAMYHLRVDAGSPEWPLIQCYIGAAEEAAMQYLNRRFYASEEALSGARKEGSAGVNPIVITPAIQAAVLIILAGLYENRGDAPSEGVPAAAMRLLDPWRTGMGM
ncbi:phage gp6-like head-tail connector protein [Salmonella enterica subsp. enterica serovar Chandans]|nr:phage gp6-like head-tail connector protein [Salmonella enterica]EDX0904766.1 phage gp6-like head-tail connector protein [Salmonella enterica subsp. enterica]EKB3331623.1 phage gp6-like head-tail connector protein [Salmonella enterica subsp. enterica serovar Chandans]EEF5710155.1 phage gp6-like head-tail connector protein [Salmonella enterica]EEG6275436.1 phage gp6-like head-tail connector protein [Salmonella enterica subsp. enterica]